METAARRAPQSSRGERPTAFDEYEARRLWDRETDVVLALDRRALRIGLRDNKRSLARPGKLRRALSRVFGERYPNALADPQLELLRRIGVLFQYSEIRFEEITEELGNAGFADYRIAAVIGLLENYGRSSGNVR